VNHRRVGPVCLALLMAGCGARVATTSSGGAATRPAPPGMEQVNLYVERMAERLDLT
jgi:hypothetical protein